MRGVVYLLCGMGAAERLAVSAHSLRRHWDGPATVMVRTDVERELAEKIAFDLNGMEVLHVPELHQRAMLSKTLIPDWTPYEETLFIDADTLIVGPLEEMFGEPLTLTRYAEWKSNKRLTAKWIGRWVKQLDAMFGDEAEDFRDMALDQLEHPFPAINTGVFAFRKDNANLRAWQHLSWLWPRAWAVDQLAMQILTSRIPHRMMDDRFNNSATHGHETIDVRIVHFHGKKHCGSRPCARQWKEAFRTSWECDIGGLRGWAGRYDKGVRRWLEEEGILGWH
jgi:hypothetical protein